jgi:hypothetical protein
VHFREEVLELGVDTFWSQSESVRGLIRSTVELQVSTKISDYRMDECCAASRAIFSTTTVENLSTFVDVECINGLRAAFVV